MKFRPEEWWLVFCAILVVLVLIVLFVRIGPCPGHEIICITRH